MALSIEPAWDYRDSSDTSWSVVELANTVTIGVVRENSGDRSLGDADESDEAYSGIMMWKEAGVLLNSIVGMIKLHQSYSCLGPQALVG